MQMILDLNGNLDETIFWVYTFKY